MLAPGASLLVADRAVLSATIRTFPETISTKDVQLVITDAVRTARVEAAFTGQRVHLFQERIIG